jgi:LemA protein
MFLSIFLVPIGLILMGSYNKMQSQAQGIKEAHSNTIVSMQKRVDLANKLVDIASSYGDHEKLTQITVAQNESVQAAMNTSQEIDGTVNRILSMARAYPDLKANQTYQNLMSQLESIENDLQQKRQDYNGRVRSYNTSCTSIPIVFVASYLGFKISNLKFPIIYEQSKHHVSPPSRRKRLADLEDTAERREHLALQSSRGTAFGDREAAPGRSGFLFPG